jgi:hypothetical protein
MLSLPVAVLHGPATWLAAGKNVRREPLGLLLSRREDDAERVGSAETALEIPSAERSHCPFTAANSTGYSTTVPNLALPLPHPVTPRMRMPICRLIDHCP